MKKYIIVYVYNRLTPEEYNFWDSVAEKLQEQGFVLFMLLSDVPKENASFLYASFTERLDMVKYPRTIAKKYKDIDFKKYLDRENLWYGDSNKDRLLAAKYQRLKYRTLIKELNPCLLILGNGNHAGDMILKDAAIDNNTPVIYIERGALPHSWHLDDLGITAGTTIAAKQFSELQLNSKALYLKYKPYYLKSKVTWWDQPERIEKLNIKQRFGVESNKKLVLFANQLNNDTSNFLYNPLFKDNLEAFKWLCENLKKKSFSGFVLAKKHPHYNGDDSIFDRVLKDNNLRGAWVDDIPLFDCIEQSDLICAVNSTMLFEAMIYEKPVLQLGDSILNKKDIVYKLQDKSEEQIMDNWLEMKGFELKKRNFELFMSYMIDNELSFYFNNASSMGFNRDLFFINKILQYVDVSKKGGYPKKFFKLNSFKVEQNIINGIKLKIKKSLKKYLNELLK